jgi:hypothetical protein
LSEPRKRHRAEPIKLFEDLNALGRNYRLVGSGDGNKTLGKKLLMTLVGSARHPTTPRFVSREPAQGERFRGARRQHSKAKRALQEIWMAETKKDALAAPRVVADCRYICSIPMGARPPADSFAGAVKNRRPSGLSSATIVVKSM